LEKKHFVYVALFMLTLAILGSTAAAYYFVQSSIYRDEYASLVDQIADNLDRMQEDSENLSAVAQRLLEGISVEANILLGYGNGTVNWENNTRFPLGSTAFTAVNSVAREVEYVDYGGELGILVTSINSVGSNGTHGWFYWHFDADNLTWALPEYSCAKHFVHRGDTIAFTYSSFEEWPPPTPT
jgi:hypothetical protein